MSIDEILRQSDDILEILSRLDWETLTPLQRAWVNRVKKCQADIRRILSWEVIDGGAA